MSTKTAVAPAHQRDASESSNSRILNEEHLEVFFLKNNKRKKKEKHQESEMVDCHVNTQRGELREERERNRKLKPAVE